VSSGADRLRRRASRTIWFLGDLVSVGGWRIGLIVLLALIESICRILVFAILIGYVRSLSGGDASVGIRGLDLPASLVDAGLVAWVGLVLVAGLATAGAGFARSLLVLRVAHDHSRHATRGILRALTPSEPGTLPPEIPDVMRSLSRDITIMYRTTRPALGLIFPTVQAILLAVALFWIDSELTFAMLVIGVFAVPFVYQLSKFVASASREHETTGAEARQKTRDTAVRMSLPQTTQAEAETLIGRLMNEPSVRTRFGPLQSILLHKTRVDAVVQVVSALAMAAIIAILSRRRPIDSDELAQLALFAILMRMALTSARKAMVTTSSIGRYYPQFSRYVDIRRTHGQAQPEAPTWDLDPSLRTTVVFSPVPLEPALLRSWCVSHLGGVPDSPVYAVVPGLDGQGDQSATADAQITHLQAMPPGIVFVQGLKFSSREIRDIATALAKHRVLFASRTIRKIQESLFDRVFYTESGLADQLVEGSDLWWNEIVESLGQFAPEALDSTDDDYDLLDED